METGGGKRAGLQAEILKRLDPEPRSIEALRVFAIREAGADSAAFAEALEGLGRARLVRLYLDKGKPTLALPGKVPIGAAFASWAPDIVEAGDPSAQQVAKNSVWSLLQWREELRRRVRDKNAEIKAERQRIKPQLDELQARVGELEGEREELQSEISECEIKLQGIVDEHKDEARAKVAAKDPTREEFERAQQDLFEPAATGSKN